MSKTLTACTLAIALGAGLIACTAPEVEAGLLVTGLAVYEIFNEDGTCPTHPQNQVSRAELVYVVDHQSTYHLGGCRVLEGQRRTCTTRQAAVAHGYHRCPKCRPA